MGATGPSGPADRERLRVSTSIRKHAPFAAFFAAIGLATVWLQWNVAPYAASLLALHLFVQVAWGATAVAALRNLIGFKTYGTFGAVILAAAMVLAGPLLGFLVLGLMLSAVLVARAALVRESVQESHRLAILIIVLAMTALAGTVAGAFGLSPGFAYMALFPILITAWLAERFVEEVVRVGWYPGLRTLGSTFAAIIVAYGIMIQAALVTFTILNPVTWTGLVALNWLLGTRVRFRLSERFRFRGTGGRPPDDRPDLSETVLTMNVRNREFVNRYNPPALLASLDKARVKEIIIPHGVPMPRSLAVIRGRRDLAEAAVVLDQVGRVAIKPASAYGGEGIVLVRGRQGERFSVNGHAETKEELLRHIQRIVDGDFNNGIADIAILEELLESDPRMGTLSPLGVADLRIVCLLGHPVMAMARLPTRMSRGRANLHAGAVGVGIDLATGRLTFAIWNGVRVTQHPDTHARIEGFQIPDWRDILEIAAQAQSLSGLGFAGVDVVLDARLGPVVLEINRRPGLEIQNANRSGLLPRLRAVELLTTADAPPEKRVEAALGLEALGWAAPVDREPAPAPSLLVPPAGGR